MPDQERMPGGVNEVLRVGGTIHRPVGSWTPAVHGLLQHLAADGFDGAPKVIGVDDEGREILTFIPGDVSNYPLSAAAASASALTSAAALLRRYHDATTGYAERHLSGWMLPVRYPIEVVCHGDFAPYNCVLAGDRAVAMIDFDTAHPGPRVWDVGYSTYRWAPLTAPENSDGFGTAEEQAARARIFCDAYGLDAIGRATLVDMIVDRLGALVDFMRMRAHGGDIAFQGHLEEGHDRIYMRDIEYILSIRHVIAAAL